MTIADDLSRPIDARTIFLDPDAVISDATARRIVDVAGLAGGDAVMGLGRLGGAAARRTLRLLG